MEPPRVPSAECHAQSTPKDGKIRQYFAALNKHVIIE